MNNVPYDFLMTSKQRFEDERGYLEVIFEQGDVVLKRSFSHAGVFRGMHWQPPPNSQRKLIRVLSGKILDFVVDVSTTPYFLHSQELSSANGWVGIDSSFAHGFYSLEPTEFEYLCFGAYAPSEEMSFSITEFLEVELGITDMIISSKDRKAPPLIVVGCN